MSQPSVWQILRAAFREVWKRRGLTAVIFAMLFIPLIVTVLMPLMMDAVLGRAGHAFFDPSRQGADPVFWQHFLWLVGHPETMMLLRSALWILVWPWMLGIWFRAETGPVRLRIGRRLYLRALMITLIAMLASNLPYVVVVVARLGDMTELVAGLCSEVLFFYLLFRMAPGVDGSLSWVAAWRSTKTWHWLCFWLAIASLALWTCVQIFLLLMAVGIASLLPAIAPGQPLFLLFVIRTLLEEGPVVTSEIVMGVGLSVALFVFVRKARVA